MIRRAVFTFPNAVMAVSTLACLVTLAVWMRSYWVRDDVWVVAQRWRFYISLTTSRGLLTVETSDIPFQGTPRPVYWRTTPPVDLSTNTRELAEAFTRAGVGTARLAGPFAYVRRDSLGFVDRWWLVSLWAVAVPAAAIPLGRLATRVRRRRRTHAALCPDCGYDCRATPDRCPECGRVIVPISRPPSEGLSETEGV